MRATGHVKPEYEKGIIVIIEREIPLVGHHHTVLTRTPHVRQRIVDESHLAGDPSRVQQKKRAVPQPQQPRGREAEGLLEAKERVADDFGDGPADDERSDEEVGSGLREAVEDSPGDVEAGADLREGCGDRRSDNSGDAVKDLEERGGLGEEEGGLDGGVDGVGAGGAEGGGGEVEDLGPAEEEYPVVEGEVGSPEGGEYSGHFRSEGWLYEL
ncbi:peptide chain release factor 1 [Striga asiatica]|uniref:Peptide chain release factor 1 n=1 Tax=Striga asiatica TaxID=4170 RepID=A0A5A7R250_STRAF|nr:peptide chain release factor 1 [Striga asiatica]